MEFWTAATGGTQLASYGDGDIFETMVSGAYSYTVWVSAEVTTELSDTADPQHGALATRRFTRFLKTRRGTVIEKWIGANIPVEVLYAVNGTSYTATTNPPSNVLLFEQAYLGIDGTDRHYYAGPGQAGFWSVVNGTDSPQIVTNVENQILADYTTAMQRHRRLVIDMTGWSHGAVIVATVALDLNTVTLNATGFTYGTTGQQHIDVHWVGLFDAVSEMGRGVTAPNNGWATAFSPNTHAQCALDTHVYRRGAGNLPNGHDFRPTTPFNFLPTGQPSTHGDVGTNAAARRLDDQTGSGCRSSSSINCAAGTT